MVRPPAAPRALHFSDFRSTRIIKGIASSAQADNSSALLFFYFDFADASTHTQESYLGSLALQLVKEFSKALQILQKFYSSRKWSFLPVTPRGEALLLVLKDMARRFLQIHIIVDALDECPNLEPVLASIRLMSEWSSRSIKFSILSRRERVIEQHMDEISPYRIQCKRKIVDAYISLYVQNQLHTTLPFNM